MKTENLKAKLIEDGYTDVEVVGKNVKVNIGNMAKNWQKSDCASERAYFDELKLSLLNWASIHGTSGKRNGGAFTIYGENDGAGRPATGVKRSSICLSGQPEQIEELKALAEKENQTVSEFVFNKAGIKQKNYYGIIVNEIMEMWFYTRAEAEEYLNKYNSDANEVNTTDSGAYAYYGEIVRGIKAIAAATGSTEYKVRQRIKEDEEFMNSHK